MAINYPDWAAYIQTGSWQELAQAKPEATAAFLARQHATLKQICHDDPIEVVFGRIKTEIANEVQYGEHLLANLEALATEPRALQTFMQYAQDISQLQLRLQAVRSYVNESAQVNEHDHQLLNRFAHISQQVLQIAEQINPKFNPRPY